MALQEEFEKRGNWLFRYRGTLPLIVLIAGELIIKETNFNYFFAAGFIFSTIAYLLIKILEKRTKLLDKQDR